VDTIDREQEMRPRRRRHTAEFKAEVVRACRQPGVSIAAVALAHGLNANLLRRWLNGRGAGTAAKALNAMSPMDEGLAAVRDSFVPVKFEERPKAAADIRLELRRGPVTVVVNWPAQEASACGAWLREWLR
jgi:transposase